MKTIITIVNLCCLLLISGCSPVKLPPLAKYTIMNFQQPVKKGRAKTRLSLLVTTPTANPGYQSHKMIYMKIPLRLEAFSRNRWVAAPGQLLLPIFVDAIRNTHYFYAVASSPFSGVTNYRLDTKILALQQEFLQPTSQIRLIVQATLLNNTTNKVIATRVFSALKSTQQNNPYSGVLTTQQVANSIARQIARFTVRNVH